MQTRTELLQYLIDTFDLANYLEIGVQNRVNFDQIDCCSKAGVDPDPAANVNTMTSDEFFERNKASEFALVFIDGLHHADQVKKDFDNSLRLLTDNGFIVLHDALPLEEIHARVPRESKLWCGDVYKFIFKLNEYDGINFITCNFDHGCVVVWKDAAAKGRPMPEEIDWNYYLQNKDQLRIVEADKVELVLSAIGQRSISSSSPVNM